MTIIIKVNCKENFTESEKKNINILTYPQNPRKIKPWSLGKRNFFDKNRYSNSNLSIHLEINGASMKWKTFVPHLWSTVLAPYTLVRYEESLAVVARFRIFMGPLPLRQWYQPMQSNVSRRTGGSSTRGSKCWTPHTRNNGAHLKTFTTPSAAFMSRVNLANSTDSFVGTECIPWPFVVSSSSASR